MPPHLTEKDREDLGMLAHGIHVNEMIGRQGYPDGGFKDWEELTEEQRNYYKRVAIKGINAMRKVEPLVVNNQEAKRRLDKFDKEQPTWTPAKVAQWTMLEQQVKIYQKAEERG